MLEISSFSTDAGLQPSPLLFDSLVNNTVSHQPTCLPVVAEVPLHYEWARDKHVLLIVPRFHNPLGLGQHSWVGGQISGPMMSGGCSRIASAHSLHSPRWPRTRCAELFAWLFCDYSCHAVGQCNFWKLTYRKVVQQRGLGMVGSLIITLLQIYCWM